MYRDGNDVPEDHGEALRWFRLAAEQGDGLGIFYVGEMHERGEGVPRDDVVALSWYLIALPRLGGNSPPLARDRVAARLSPAQIAAAERLAAEWQTAHPGR